MIKNSVSEKSPGWNVSQELPMEGRGKKAYLHTVSLDAPSMAAAHIYAAIPDIDIIYCPCLLLVKRSWLMPSETSGLRPLKKKRIIMKDVVEKKTCPGVFEQVHGRLYQKYMYTPNSRSQKKSSLLQQSLQNSD